MSDPLAHVRLMTMLNVKATHPRKEDENMPKKRVRTSVPPHAAPVRNERPETPTKTEPDEPVAPVLVAEDDDEDRADAFQCHFAEVNPENLAWKEPEHIRILGGAVVTRADRSLQERPVSRPHARVWRAFEAKHALSRMQSDVLECIGTYTDFWHSRVAIQDHDLLRQVCAMHAMSHIAKTRQRILKNNEKLAKAAAAHTDDDDELPEFRDQGFTRPKVLLVVPFRHTAKVWVDMLMSYAGCEQVEQKTRFHKEFSLPPGSFDKLADPEFAHRYPDDHRHTFQGNIDDNFKLGIKLTRKTLKLYSPFYESDVIVASPLGLRLLIEKEHEHDYLSSMEVVMVDQMDVMLMQNWDHVRFILACVNQIPKEAHDTDFSRVRPWYLDGHASLLRQTILFSAFDAPEFRQLFHSLRNVGGKVRTTALGPDDVPSMSLVPPGVRQTFFRFECSNPQSEGDQRLTAFKERILSLLKKSAVSASHTMIIVPSYFDFVRLEDDFRRMDPPVSYTTLTEYSTGRDISRAREAFFSGKKSVLLLTERFHFYRRYLIRGAITVVFYAPPEHAVYYPEFIRAPLSVRDASSAAPTDPADLQVWTLFCKYDLLRLERVLGASQARKMLTGTDTSYRFL